LESAEAGLGHQEQLPGLGLSHLILWVFGDKDVVESLNTWAETKSQSPFLAWTTSLSGQECLAIIAKNAVEMNQVATSHHCLGGPEIHGLKAGGLDLL